MAEDRLRNSPMKSDNFGKVEVSGRASEVVGVGSSEGTPKVRPHLERAKLGRFGFN